jgi:hypothetical protein
MTVHTRRGRRRLIVAAALVVGAVGAVLAPLASGQQGPSPVPQGCQLQVPQPEAPLKLNLVAAGRFVKTVVMEKEVFNCFDGQTDVAQIRDVETFIELVGQVVKGKGKHPKAADKGKTGKPSVKLVAKRVEVVTCIKSFRTDRVSCGAKDMQIGATGTPLTGCSPRSGTYPFDPVVQPAHPVEMSTVVLKDGVVQTMKVEKEVFDCEGRIGDVYLFTDIVEAPHHGKTIRPVAKRFHGVICLKDAGTAKVVSCRVFTPARLS